MKQKRTVVKRIRCTPDEAQEISEAAKAAGMNESRYIRTRIFSRDGPQIPEEAFHQLSELNYQIRRIGININQVVRACNEQKHISRSDFRQLVEYEKMLDRNFEKTLRLMEKTAKEK